MMAVKDREITMSEAAAPALYVGIQMAERWRSIIHVCDAQEREGLSFAIDDGADGLFADIHDLPRADTGDVPSDGVARR